MEEITLLKIVIVHVEAEIKDPNKGGNCPGEAGHATKRAGSPSSLARNPSSMVKRLDCTSPHTSC